MGSTFRLPVVDGLSLDAALDAARDHDADVLAAIPRGGVSLYDTDLGGASLVLIGGEGGGLDDAISARADAALSIPMRSDVDSLNTAVAAALIVYEARRQRMAAQPGCRRDRVMSPEPGQLFEPDSPDAVTTPAPLAERMRPRTFDEFVGQTAVLGPGRPLRHAIEQDTLQSIILWGPPGTGKTTVARLIANATDAHFVAFSAVLSGIKDIKAVMAEAERTRRHRGRRTTLFVDEIHRFNKAQQDAFLPRVEAGDIVLIGATTENPSFEVNAALLSRSRVYVLHPLEEDDLKTILRRAVDDPSRGLGHKPLDVDDDALGAMARHANGDARVALNLLELAAALADSAAAGPREGSPERRARIDVDLLAQAVQRRALLYDKQGEEHFNLISALHKSMRNSDPDAAVYWLARMVEAGEDPLYIARRLVRFASEDIGNADPRALTLARRGQRCRPLRRDARGKCRARSGGDLSRGRAEEQRGVHGLWAGGPRRSRSGG